MYVGISTQAGTHTHSYKQNICFVPFSNHKKKKIYLKEFEKKGNREERERESPGIVLIGEGEDHRIGSACFVLFCCRL